MRRLWLTLAVVGVTGCSTTLTTLQTARPAKPKQVMVTGGAGFYANLGPPVRIALTAVDQGKKLYDDARADRRPELTEPEVQEILEGAIGFAMFTPGYTYEIAARTGILPDWDVGLRYSITAIRLDTKYRIFHSGDDMEMPKAPELTPTPAPAPAASPTAVSADATATPAPSPAAPTAPPAYQKPLTQQRSFDVALGFAVSRYIFDNPLVSALNYVKMDDFSRWDFEVPLYVSMDFGDVFKLYTAPKYIYSRMTMDPKLSDLLVQSTNITGFDLTIPDKFESHFFGASFGLAAGYRYAHLFLELTAGYTRSTATFFGSPKNFSGVTLHPAIGLQLKFPG